MCIRRVQLPLPLGGCRAEGGGRAGSDLGPHCVGSSESSSLSTDTLGSSLIGT